MSSKTKHFLSWLAVLVFTAAGLVWFLDGRRAAPKPHAITTDAAIERINSKKIKEITFTSSTMEMTAVDGSVTATDLFSDSDRMELLHTIVEFNKRNSQNSISFREEPR